MSKARKVQSSSIDRMDWKGDELYVWFGKGPTHYVYQNVPEKIWNLFCQVDDANAELKDTEISLGSFFHYLVKIHPEKYPYTKVEA